jgi:NADH-quinone oxidoreductase subunit L
VSDLVDLVWLIPALPLAAFAAILVLGRRLGDPLAGWLATLSMAGAFAATVLVFLGLRDLEHERRATQTLFEWVPAGGLHVDAGFLVDPLSVTMALFVTGVGSLIFLYSIGYMHGDRDFSKFFLYLSLFAFSMLVLVLGENLLMTFLGWEGVGLCSYLLISFWFGQEANASAGKKAFVTNRVGDWGFMLAMFLAFASAGTLQYTGLFEQVGDLAPVTVTAIVLLLFVGAVGKSAQLPLFVWLPDAMAGPTPVSALIHAATMVTAGVYLMTRAAPLLDASYDWAPTLIATVGAATALFAATIAVAQNDIKRVLAYSTVSQLGYMFLAVGTGAYVAAVFHMVTHAFFKALLFLGSGSVIHGMHEEQDMRRMGALRTVMPVTAGVFIVGWLAIAGVPPFAGFWSKDDILLNAWVDNKALWAVGFVTALLTAFYMSRQVFMVFYGEARWDEARPHESEAERSADEVDDDAEAHVGEHGEGVRPHESGWLMLFPLLVLAGLSLVGGLLNLPFGHDTTVLANWLHPVVEGLEAEVDAATGTKVALAVVTAIGALCAIGVAALVYLRKRIPAARVEPELLAHGWYYDEAISSFADGPGRAGFEGAAAFDRTVVDGAVNGVAAAVRFGGSKLRAVQSGYVRNYALGIAIGAVVLVGLFLTQVSL